MFRSILERETRPRDGGRGVREMNHTAQQQQDSRTLSRVVRGMHTSDGAGVDLTRVIGAPELSMLDPFLLLDVFRSDDPDDYIAGFPPHPHRGFETVTYILNGRMRHKDNAGHEGVIEPGGVQWMTAGRGIVHSEMPEQEQGLLAGFQLWVNLPAAHKMDAPAYQEFPDAVIPIENREDGSQVKVVAGRTHHGTEGPVRQPLTEPRYYDVRVPAGGTFNEALPGEHNAFVFVYEGQVMLDDMEGRRGRVGMDELGILSRGNHVTLEAGTDGARFLLVSGKPLNEPVARGGPFVMNTEAELRQAFTDYRSGNF
jgi:redox-sensitive bicupin YhaK (pirin superfamily)